MRKGQEIEILIDDIKYGGEGFGFYNEKPVYVKGAIPSEKLKVRITKKKKDYADGKILEKIEEAPYAIKPACPHFNFCGGCLYQHVSYEKQLEFKKDQIIKLMVNNSIEGFTFDGIHGSPDAFGYRNKMEFSFGNEVKDGELCLGMHLQNKAFSVFTSDSCNIVHEDFQKILKETLKYFKEKGTPHYRVMSTEGILRNLVVRRASATGEILVNLVTTSGLTDDLEEYKNRLLSLGLAGEICGILHTKNDNLADTVSCDELKILYGRDYINEEVLGLKFKITPFSFFQTNTKGAEVLYSVVRDFLGDASSKTVFDLYCGTGTIGQIAAGKAKKVIGIEIVPEAVEAATENAKLNGLTNCTFIAGDVAETVSSVKEQPDIIVLDPPRPGVMEKALKNVVAFGAPVLIYVSCNPKTLVNDLGYLNENGYKVERVAAVDMFPMTPHVETVVRLKKKYS